MFESLSDRLSLVFSKLTRTGLLTESNVDEALREVRRALLEADVALPVVKDFLEKVREKAVGEEVVKSVSPGQTVIKIVNDQLTELLGSENVELNLKVSPPAILMIVGLQGSGKTTTSAKLANYIKNKYKQKTIMASLDVNRPAAQEQLEILGIENSIDTLPIVKGQKPIEISKRAIKEARLGGFDVLILDTAGRMHVDNELMNELENINKEAKATEIILVADSLTGQDAVNVASTFSSKIPLTGVILTRLDGDARGGAALSMKHITGQPIKFIGTGEKIDNLEEFYPDRTANRILGMGDIVSLVERAKDTIDNEKANKIAKKISKGIFDLDDMSQQLNQMSKMGGVSGILGMLPGISKVKKQLAESNMNDKIIKRQVAIISSMTPREKRNPKILNASRKKRIARGSGTEVPEINKLIKIYRQTSDMMKKFGKKGMLDADFEMPDIKNNQINKLNDSNINEKMLSHLGSNTTGKNLPGLPGLPGSQNKLNNLLNLTGRKK
ncbi:MAG: signal recognition particle protein [Cellvibrionales bacterium TMED49]|jgi:signal recognition particle subunit SRP54|uniref:Signal recognition particle protein n=1 Tax=PS1 clade bacterium TaxID=2175152 RepID=A0A368DT60_9PROT|nr:signal recognition particle protein [Rhodobiaceae bacterium]OUT75042.1 MAG: signal recognition particle protein [Rhizobiales bacterium TMED25]OUU40454.1 MAG: signal recognition particle protein [Cellvibrionales bacterium TMED49]RCL74395.1 MAG: signal recognition particle protein [PS1 clade bacterium]MAU86833.1 signal recognition particle protein [Rhodobiaceae bacterium]|tara:strand:+ start:44441 stop:45940 length:1500 start_codon:yes stop_codon:yes gene_type:complete